MSDPYYTTKVDGTGLGLSITRRAVLAHGGKITFKTMKPDIIEIAVCLPNIRSEGLKEQKDRV
ncbi:MAG: hypothetical protein U5R49_25365 [Deltaproteobacteria bacterium]|nr:hypothetical protein [Deltaproteobacteria bacterium]